jgi:hypothetical protein
LMPLRLARYGVPLAETAPAGLAAAGIEPALLPPLTVEQGPAAVQADALALEARTAGRGQQPEPVSTEAQRVAGPAGGRRAAREQASIDDADGRFAKAYQLWRAQFQTEPTAAQFAYLPPRRVRYLHRGR